MKERSSLEERHGREESRGREERRGRGAARKKSGVVERSAARKRRAASRLREQVWCRREGATMMPNGEELTERVKERHYGDDAAAERGGVEKWSGVRSGATSRAEAA